MKKILIILIFMNCVFAGETYSHDEATFDISSGELHIPKVVVGNDAYEVNMQYTGELSFLTTDINLISDLDNTNAFYNFDEETGAIAYDSSGNEFNGDIVAASRTDGKIGNALLFGAADARVEMPWHGYFEEGYISIEAWIKLSEVEIDSIYRIIGDYNYHAIAFQIRDGKLEVISDEQSYIVGNQVLLPDIWTYIAFTSNGTEIKTYVNGVEDNSTTITFPANVTSTWSIGVHQTYDNSASGFRDYIEEFPGIIDELRIWDIARSEENIWDYYQETK